MMEKAGKGRIFENLLRNHQNSLKALFQRRRSSNEENSACASPKPIPQLSTLANSVVFSCSKIVQVSAEELQHRFDSELPESVKELLTYARNFLEFCSFQALQSVSKRPDYLSDKEFRRLTYDMMLAWECPCVESESPVKETASCSDQQIEDEDGPSLFYSNSTKMAVQVDDKKTVGPEAFSRIAPACIAVADIITVHNLFDALTSSSGHRLHFLVYDKYIRSLDKVIKGAKNSLVSSIGSLQLSQGEIVLDCDGMIPTQPVLQHIGIAAWPGRLTLTSGSLYFELLGVGVYDKVVRYDLTADLKQVIKPELTGPLGTRLFDKALMYKSTSVEEPVYWEFPEFKGNTRRDYWLGICLEILRAHRFIRKNNLKGSRKSEVLGRAILGIFRIRAIREAFRIFATNYKTLLTFNLAESLPGGDLILETLSSRLLHLQTEPAVNDSSESPYTRRQQKLSPVFLLTLRQLGFPLEKEEKFDEDGLIVGDVAVGEINPLELAVKQSISDSGRAEAAQATVDRVKVEGIDTNVAVMKELLFPVIELANRVQRLASWEDPFKSTVFMALACYAILRGWISLILPSILLLLGVFMLWQRHFFQGKPLEALQVTHPPTRNAVEQLLTLQDGVGQVEASIQAANIILLKMRALLFAVLPQATERVALLLILLALVFAFVPFKYICVFAFVEAYTRELSRRKESRERVLRRVREWWVRIPAAPVQLIRLDDGKKKKH